MARLPTFSAKDKDRERGRDVDLSIEQSLSLVISRLGHCLSHQFTLAASFQIKTARIDLLQW